MRIALYSLLALLVAVAWHGPRLIALNGYQMHAAGLMRQASLSFDVHQLRLAREIGALWLTDPYSRRQAAVDVAALARIEKALLPPQDP